MFAKMLLLFLPTRVQVALQAGTGRQIADTLQGAQVAGDGIGRCFQGLRIIAGQNNLQGNAIAVFFGVFMYFPTLVEVPVAKMFLDLGMHPGPLLAYLMADPELSLQSILMIAAVIGRKKTFTYVGWVAIFSVIAGLLFGSWVDIYNIVI